MYLILFLVGIVLAFAGAVLIRYAVPVVDAGAGGAVHLGHRGIRGRADPDGTGGGRAHARPHRGTARDPALAAAAGRGRRPRGPGATPGAPATALRRRCRPASLAARLVRPRRARLRRPPPRRVRARPEPPMPHRRRSISRRSPACRRSRASPAPAADRASAVRHRRSRRRLRQGRPRSPAPHAHPRDDGLQVRRDRRHGLYAVHGRLDRGRAATGQGQVRVGRRAAEVSDDAGPEIRSSCPIDGGRGAWIAAEFIAGCAGAALASAGRALAPVRPADQADLSVRGGRQRRHALPAASPSICGRRSTAPSSSRTAPAPTA